MSWFIEAFSERARIQRNIRRYEELRGKIAGIKKTLFATQSGAYSKIQDLLDDKLVKVNDEISSKLSYLLNGENNQKLVLDSPHRSSDILVETILDVDQKISEEALKLRAIEREW